MIGDETSLLRFRHCFGQDRRCVLMADHDMSRDKSSEALQLDVSHSLSQPRASTFWKVTSGLWRHMRWKHQITTQSWFVRIYNLDPLHLSKMQKKKKKINFNAAIEMPCKLSYANHNYKWLCILHFYNLFFKWLFIVMPANTWSIFSNKICKFRIISWFVSWH